MKNMYSHENPTMCTVYSSIKPWKICIAMKIQPCVPMFKPWKRYRPLWYVSEDCGKYILVHKPLYGLNCYSIKEIGILYPPINCCGSYSKHSGFDPLISTAENTIWAGKNCKSFTIWFFSRIHVLSFCWRFQYFYVFFMED